MSQWNGYTGSNTQLCNIIQMTLRKTQSHYRNHANKKVAEERIKTAT